ncbi:MAG: hypothetical protein IJ789_05435 [Bacteroidales bacterium]|nr:hypothetical protein [Bacteroidales bacterium]
MKKIVILLIAILPLIGTTAMAQNGRDLEDDGLVGNVKRIDAKMFEVSYDRHDNLVVGEQLEHLLTEYNAKGQRRSMTYMSVAEDIIFRTRYKHDGFGLTTLEHVVDNQEQVIGRTYYVYNSNLVLTEIYVEDVERQVESRLLIKRDATGRITQRSYNDQFNDVYKREVYTYNPTGDVAKAVIYDRSKAKIQERRYEYDENRQPVSYTLFDYTEDEPEVFVTLFEYEYDAYGNWIRRTEYNLNGDRKEPVYTTQRTIEYF